MLAKHSIKTTERPGEKSNDPLGSAKDSPGCDVAAMTARQPAQHNGRMQGKGTSYQPKESPAAEHSTDLGHKTALKTPQSLPGVQVTLTG
jgi:hypothetical protein